MLRPWFIFAMVMTSMALPFFVIKIRRIMFDRSYLPWFDRYKHIKFGLSQFHGSSTFPELGLSSRKPSKSEDRI